MSHGIMSVKAGLPGRVPTLAKLMADQGFVTGAIVNSPWLKQKSFRLTRGFEKFLYIKPVANRKMPSTRITDRAMEWLGDLGDERMFLFLHYFDVHSDYASLPKFERIFDEPYEGQADGTSWQLRQATLAESYLEMCQTNFDKDACSLGGGPESYLVDHTVEKVFYDDADIRHLKNLYDAGVRQLDTELSRLFGFLYEKELLDKTLLIILSDHGEGFSEHGEVDHFLSTYQELLHVPLLIRGPGVPRGKRIAAPVSLIDIVPTILRQVDAPLPEPLDGFDLAPLWREGAKDETRRTFDERFLYGEASGGITWSLIAEGHYPIYRSVRRGQYKMVHRDPDDRYELFDLESDPEESIDIAGKQPQILADLKEEMTERYSEFSATPSDEHKVEIDEEDAKALRALGYIQ
jgi:arylsulfatase A-like enzyme